MTCTIGAKILSTKEVVLFKNKDFDMKGFDDRISVDRWYVGVMGRWLAFATDLFSGLSIGFNKSGICCCDSLVRSIEGARNGDILVEKVIHECTDVEDAIELVQAETKQTRYDWINIVLASPEEVAVLEVCDEVKTVRKLPFAVRTNHHVERHGSRIDHSMGKPRIRSSKSRYRCAKGLLQEAASLEDIFNLCKSHVPRKSYSICRHGHTRTVYGYIVYVSGGETFFYVCKGNPCKAIYTPISITFPIEDQKVSEILERYPSKNP